MSNERWSGHDLYGEGKFVSGYLLDLDQEPELREVGRFNCAGIAERAAAALNAPDDGLLSDGYAHMRDLCSEAQDGWAAERRKLWAARTALERMVYETTHGSPCEDDQSHRCTISGEALAMARQALAGQVGAP